MFFIGVIDAIAETSGVRRLKGAICSHGSVKSMPVVVKLRAHAR